MRHLTISEEVYQLMLKSAMDSAPVEACALLAGKGSHIDCFYSMVNADNSAEHYSFLPEQQFAAVKAFRAGGKQMLGIWHSHPASPARMSDEDMRLAYTPDVAYFILSLADRDRPVLKAFDVVDSLPSEIDVKINGGKNHE